MPSSNKTDYDVLAATTSTEDMTEDVLNQDTLWSLKNADLCHLRLCSEAVARDFGDFRPGSSKELGWLGHFVKKSTNLHRFLLGGNDVFINCTEQSVDGFFEDLGNCNHITEMTFFNTDLTEVIYKLDRAMKNNNIAECTVVNCNLGVPGANYLFNTFRGMKSLEFICISYEDDDDHDLDDNVMTGCISSLAACTSMRNVYKLDLQNLNMSTNSCAALSVISLRMTALREVSLYGNMIDDGCLEDLVRGLAECAQLQSLSLSSNRIGDDGLDVLVQGLPASVQTLHLSSNQITLARELSLLRFEALFLSWNSLCPSGPGVIAASLADPECQLGTLHLRGTNIGDEGAAILADSLRSNQRLLNIDLEGSNITEMGWKAFSSILCDAASINATHASNHTLQVIGYHRVPQDIETLLELNSGEDKSIVAAKKILQTHLHLDMEPLFGKKLDLLPYVIAWLERFAETRLDLKLSSIFQFTRAMPMEVASGVTGKKKKS